MPRQPRAPRPLRRPLTWGAAGFGVVGLVGLGLRAGATVGGPDAAGLGFTDDAELGGPPTAPVPMDGGGGLGLAAGASTTLPLGWAFDWGGTSHRSVTVYNDGRLIFDPGSGSFGCPGAGDWSGVSAFAQPWAAGAAHARTIGRYPRRTLVVDWAGVHPAAPDGAHVQVLLPEHGDEIAVLLDDVDFGDPSLDGGAGAQVGVAAGPGTGVAWSCSGGLVSGSAAVFGVLADRPTAAARSVDALEAPWIGALANGYAGQALAQGDVNGDGLAEIAVGSPTSGRVALLGGGLGAWGGSLGGAAAQLRATRSGSRAGAGLLLRDLDGDGLAEVIIGDPGDDSARTDAGAVFVLDGGPLAASQTVPADARLELRGPALPLDGRMVSSWSPSEAGAALGAGDVDGDGYVDLIIGAPAESTVDSNAGAVFVWRGAGADRGLHLLADADTVLLGEQAGDELGLAIAAGDLDLDGADELALGSLGDLSTGLTNSGLGLLLADPGPGRWSALSAARAVVVGQTLGGELGAAVALADFDQDGLLDVAFGAPSASDLLSRAGSVSVFSDAGGLVGELGSDDADVVLVSDAANASFGASLAVDALGGAPTLVVGAPTASFGGPTGAGLVARWDAPLAAGSGLLSDADFVLFGADTGGALGRAALIGPPADGSSGLVLVASAPFADGPALSRPGAIYRSAVLTDFPDDDGDGYLSMAQGGPDCDDRDPAVSPAGVEAINGQDDDCDGWIDDLAVLRADADEWAYDLGAELGTVDVTEAGALVDFEDAPLGANLRDRYRSLGLRFEPGAGLVAAASAWGAPAVGAVGAVHVPASAGDPLAIQLSEPVDALSFVVLDGQGDAWLSASADGVELLSDVRVPVSGDDLPGGVFVGLTFAEPIDRVEIAPTGGDAFGIDALQLIWSAGTDRDGDGFSDNDGDCDDRDPARYPGAPEDLGNYLDDDCDGVVDAGRSVVWPDPVDFGGGTGIDAQIIDFEGLTVGALPTEDYADLGVHLAGDLRVSTSAGAAGPRGLRLGRATGDGVELSFDEVQPALGFYAVGVVGALRVEGLVDGSVVYDELVVVDGDAVDEGVFVGLSFEYGVDALRLTNESAGDAWGIDDLIINVLGLDDADLDSFSERDGDCDDHDPEVFPGAVEVWYDGVDQDCSGGSDYDVDGDGYGSSAYGGLDCDDGSGEVSPDAAELWYDGVDADCDGLSDFDVDGDGFDSAAYGGSDCADGDSGVSPSAMEVWYDGIDGDCGEDDDYDADGDGVGGGPGGGGGGGAAPDCDDADPSVRPGALELWYDGVDSDCGGEDDFDADGDGFSSVAHGGFDCNDLRPEVNPAAPLDPCYDGVDQDCNGSNDFDCDQDGFNADGYGGLDCDDARDDVNPDAADPPRDGLDQDCDGSPEFDDDGDGFDGAEDGGPDCDDDDVAVSPAATEVWYDGIDQNCDLRDDFDADRDGARPVAWGGTDCDDTRSWVRVGARDLAYDGVDANCDGADDFDADRDGHRPLGLGGLDCDDNNAARRPGAAEVWYDGIDQNCDGRSDQDADLDGMDRVAAGGADCDDRDPSIGPGSLEIPLDGIDQDCDGLDDVDLDEDGALSAADCDDADATVRPGAPDPCYDAVDSDCAGDDDLDCDQDGVLPPAFGGLDCDDLDPAVRPGATDRWYDGVDSDCGGEDDDDRDGDGSAALARGGPDCDDGDPAVGPHVLSDGCDDQDNDCDGVRDEDCGGSSGGGSSGGGSSGGGSSGGGSSGGGSSGGGSTDGGSTDGGSADGAADGGGGGTGAGDGGTGTGGGGTGAADGGTGAGDGTADGAADGATDDGSSGADGGGSGADGGIGAGDGADGGDGANAGAEGGGGGPGASTEAGPSDPEKGAGCGCAGVQRGLGGGWLALLGAAGALRLRRTGRPRR